MSIYRLDRLLSPRSVAVVGASPRQGSLGRAILRNLRDGGFPGRVDLVNPHHPEVDGFRAVKTLADLGAPPDVVVVAVPPPVVLPTIEAAGEIGASSAIIITAGLGHGPGSIAAAIDAAARRTGLRIVGPNCLGVLAPGAKFNASFAAQLPAAGDLALISQSGAIAAGMVEWAAEHNIGFSAIVSVGDQLDVDIGDLLDFFALDRSTRAILLYIESINDARKFMSAARAAARVKPVVVVKAGRMAAGARAAATHTGALAGSDAVYDAAFRRAGLLRVFNLEQLFDAAETLGRLTVLDGNRLAILTNGGGLGVLAVDLLTELGGKLATLSPEARDRLDKVLPATWSRANPVDIIGDADAARYCAALQLLLADPDNDAVLVMYVRTAITSPTDIATGVIDTIKHYRTTTVRPKPALAVWLGTGSLVADKFVEGRIPSYATEADAVCGFMHLAQYQEVQRALMDTPPSLPTDFSPDVASARQIVQQALADSRRWLDPIEANKILAAYSIPAIQTIAASDPEQAATAAAGLLAAGQSVVIKILSRDIVHKSDVGGVRLNLTSEAAVKRAAAEVIAGARAARPDAGILGVTVQPMIVRPHARELIVGIADDATFGPVIAFGHGGTAVEVINDRALALPPLDLRMAHELIARTRVARLLHGYRNVAAANEDEIAFVLVKLAQLAADFPEVSELDINPLLADESGVLALDARIAVAAVQAPSRWRMHSHLAIRPYPAEWQRRITLDGALDIDVRPVRPQDEPLFVEFLKRVTPMDMRMRFFSVLKDFNHAMIARFTQLDYARAIAFIALDRQTSDMIGVVRLHADANYEAGEYAILVRSDMKGRGLGWTLMQLIVEYARSEGLRRIEGQVLRDNTTMLRMCSEFGFSISEDPEDPETRQVRLSLG
jgi:acetyltransferase